MKRILSVLLAALLLAVPTSAATTLTTSNLPGGGLTFSVEGDTFTVSGAIQHTSLSEVWIHVGEDSQVLSTKSGQPIQYSVKLTGDTDREVTVYTRRSGDELYWSYVWRTVFLHKTESGWVIEDTTAYDHNQTFWNATWVNPADCLSEVDPTVSAKAWEIVGDTTGDYTRLQKLYAWVTENIYYGVRSDGTLPLTATEVLAEGYSVCQGYATLLMELCHAVGIPSLLVNSWSAGTGSDGYISTADTEALLSGATETNHAHVAAWVDGRWIQLDPTWDSPNRYENDQKISGTSSGWMYFDSTMEYLSRSHLILSVSVTATAENTPSTWAFDEVRSALAHGLVPLNQQKNYTAEITRADFCTLLMTMLTAKENCTDIDALLQKKNVTVQSDAFTDIAETDTHAILAANALGIVNGRGGGIFDPQAHITRQEAAVMLMRTAQVLEIDMGAEPKSFSDMTDASEWAAMGILYTSSLVAENGKAVMGGVSETKFSPLTGYTREQAMLTMERMLGVKGK